MLGMGFIAWVKVVGSLVGPDQHPDIAQIAILGCVGLEALLCDVVDGETHALDRDRLAQHQRLVDIVNKFDEAMADGKITTQERLLIANIVTQLKLPESAVPVHVRMMLQD